MSNPLLLASISENPTPPAHFCFSVPDCRDELEEDELTGQWIPYMIVTVRAYFISAALILFLCTSGTVHGEGLWGCGSRGTLFHWGEGFTGGPDLDEPLVTDRPDFTEASSTVGMGVTQFEIGYTYTFDNDGTDQVISHTYPESLMRHGLFANWFELRLAANVLSEQVNGASTLGREDQYVGFKIGLTPQHGWLPEMALIPQMTIPTGSDNRTADKVLPGVNWIYAWDLGNNFSLGASTQVNRGLDDLNDDFAEWAQSIAVGASLTDIVGVYAEWYAILPPNSAVGADDEHYINGGFTVLLSNDVMWDVRAGVGLNDFSDDYFVGTGLSIRFR